MTKLRPRPGLMALVLCALPASGMAAEGAQLVDRYCSGCHQPQAGEGSWSRISAQRKTPEGWDMTIARMGIMHGVQVPGEDRRELVKYLADSRGLAPQESAPQRALIERRLNRVESFDHPTFQQMCARCHTGGRVLLQRRTEEDWAKLVNFHVGQYQTLEFQSNARDRDWLGLALDDIVPWLGDNFSVQSDAWDSWQQATPVDPTGRFQMWGSWPGQGAFVAAVEIEAAEGDDAYRMSVDGHFLDGRELQGQGMATLFTGYEWRAQLSLDGQSLLQVLDFSQDMPSGRVFDADDEAMGMQVTLLPEAQETSIEAVLPRGLKAGERTTLAVIGTGLDADALEVGEGLEVIEVLKQENGLLLLEVAVDGSATPGWRALRQADATLERKLAVYDRVDRLEISPDFAVARVGAEQTPAVSGVFRVEGYLEGEGQQPIALGEVPVNWSVSPWDETAEQDGDVTVAGVMDKASGIFSPSGAGPNPERKYDTNNAGNLRVSATARGQSEAVSDDAQLIVTVQRWNNPPLR